MQRIRRPAAKYGERVWYRSLSNPQSAASPSTGTTSFGFDPQVFT
jgi:hypothetical protein